jgi:hypothetical protein
MHYVKPVQPKSCQVEKLLPILCYVHQAMLMGPKRNKRRVLFPSFTNLLPIYIFLSRGKEITYCFISMSRTKQLSRFCWQIILCNALLYMKPLYKTLWFVLPQHSGWSYLTCSARSLGRWQQQPMQRLEHDPAKRLGSITQPLHDISGENNSKCYPHKIWLDQEHAPLTIILRILKFHCVWDLFWLHGSSQTHVGCVAHYNSGNDAFVSPFTAQSIGHRH